MTQVPSFLPAWMTGICGSNRSTYCRHSLLSQQPPDQSTLHCSPPRYRCGEPLARTPIPPEFQDKVKLTLTCQSGHQQIHGDIEPSPVVLGEQGVMEKTTQRFQRIATTLADLNAEGLNAQAVNDLLTMYVGGASQHVLRMSFVPHKRLTTSTDRSRPFVPTSFNATSPLRCFFYPSNSGDLVWALQFSAMLLLHGALGNRSSPH